MRQGAGRCPFALIAPKPCHACRCASSQDAAPQNTWKLFADRLRYCNVRCWLMPVVGQLSNCDVRFASVHPPISDMMLKRPERRNGPEADIRNGPKADHAYSRRLRRQFAGSVSRQARARPKRGGALEIGREIRRPRCTWRVISSAKTSPSPRSRASSVVRTISSGELFGASKSRARSVSMKPACSATTWVSCCASSRRRPLVSAHASDFDAP